MRKITVSSLFEGRFQYFTADFVHRLPAQRVFCANLRAVFPHVVLENEECFQPGAFPRHRSGVLSTSQDGFSEEQPAGERVNLVSVGSVLPCAGASGTLWRRVESSWQFALCNVLPLHCQITQETFVYNYSSLLYSTTRVVPYTPQQLV